MTQLSEHFSLEEFLRSETAARAGREITLETPDIEPNLKRWCDLAGEVLRARIGNVIVVLSGYRPPWLNSLVGGAATSAHMFGCAADIIVPRMTPAAVCRAVEAAVAEIPFDQVILEFGHWCHLSVARPGVKPRGDVYTAHKVKGALGLVTRYTPGIHEELFA